MTPSNIRVVAVLCALMGLLAVPATCARPVTVTIDSGSLTGTYTSTNFDAGSDADADAKTTGDVARFLGIRFGEPPVRFAPAQPAKPWSGMGSTPYDASSYGPTCLQQFNGAEDERNRSMRWFNSPPFVGPESEDCLFLNVFAPGSALSESGAAAAAAQRKAVMVWIYGGSFRIGSGALPAYDGTEFAARHDVLVVTFNYRVGVFGFPGAPQIADEEQNLGLLDQRLALRWVQRNIAAFGGDPRRVTIFGESAGAGSVDMLLTSSFGINTPAADLPFSAAIMQSGQGTAGVSDADASKESWTDLADALDCPTGGGDGGGDGLLCMRTVPATRLRDTAGEKSLTFFPIHDGGATWSNQPRRDRQAGRVARVPVLIGSNAREGDVMVYGRADVKAYLKSRFPPGTPFSFINDLLTGSWFGMPGFFDLNGQAARIITEYSFQCPSGLIVSESRAIGIPAWRYFYNASFPNTDIYPGSGAYHSAEIKTLFGTFPAQDATPFQKRLHLAMQSAWATFAKNPTQGPGWPYSADKVALLGGGAAPGLSDQGREPITMIYTADIDRRCVLYTFPYALTP
ncbi:hypothetical protein E4U54_004763 [Claviceps lovelessii]|nr:hypothetical protein E4U54_004763 [Claviceps lovelessii]